MFCTRQREHKGDDGFKLGQQKPRYIRYVLMHQIITATQLFSPNSILWQNLEPTLERAMSPWWQFCMMASNICRSWVWNLLHVTVVVSRILSWFWEVWKICALLPWTTSILTWMSYDTFTNCDIKYKNRYHRMCNFGNFQLQAQHHIQRDLSLET